MEAGAGRSTRVIRYVATITAANDLPNQQDGDLLILTGFGSALMQRQTAVWRFITAPYVADTAAAISSIPLANRPLGTLIRVGSLSNYIEYVVAAGADVVASLKVWSAPRRSYTASPSGWSTAGATNAWWSASNGFCTVEIDSTMGGTVSGISNPSWLLPAECPVDLTSKAGVGISPFSGSAVFSDDSAGTRFIATPIPASTSRVTLRVITSSAGQLGAISSSQPVNAAVGDQISLVGTYPIG